MGGVGETAERVRAQTSVNSQDKYHRGSDLSIITRPCTYVCLDTDSKGMVVNQLVPGRPTLVLGFWGPPYFQLLRGKKSAK